MADIAVSIKQVSFSYGERPVLTDVNLALAPASLTVLRGANGAGKSTLLSLILGDSEPEAGTIEVLGINPASRKAARELGGKIGVVPQRVPADYRRFPVTVYELVLGGLYRKTPKIWARLSWQKEAAEAAIAEVDLKGRENALLSELSGGQLQRALLARAMVSKPELLILDEPTSSLDEQNVTKLAEAVEHAVRTLGAACLFVTHDLARLPRCYDRVVELDHGRLYEIALDTVEESCHCGDFPDGTPHVHLVPGGYTTISKEK